jgi:hypothetical protein
LGTLDTNRHWPGNIGYTRYKKILAWQHWVHKRLYTQCFHANVCFHLVYPMLPGPCLFLSCVPNVARPVSVFILCTQCCQASICLYLVYPMLPGQCLFVSCVPNVARPVSVFILCTQCCPASICFYLVYPMLTGQCLFLSCVPNVARSLSICIMWRHGPGNIGYKRYKQTRA